MIPTLKPKILMSKNEHDMRTKGKAQRAVYRNFGESVDSRSARVKGLRAIKQKADLLASEKRIKKQKAEITKPDTNFTN